MTALHLPTGINPPDQWQWWRLDDLCDGTFDCPHTTPLLSQVGPLVVRSQDIRSGVLRIGSAARVSEQTYLQRIARVEPREGDLLYSREGTYFGIAALVPPDTRLCLGQRMFLIRPAAGVIRSRFLWYWLNSPFMSAHARGFRDGSVAERLNLPSIRGLPVLLPPIHEQIAIEALIAPLDEKVELNRRMKETIAALGQGLAGRATRDVAERRLADVAMWDRTIVNPSETPAMMFDHFSLPAFDDGQMPVRETGAQIKSQKLRVPRDAVLLAKLNPHIPRVWRPDDAEMQNPVASTEWVVLRPIERGAADLLHALVSSEDFLARMATLTTGTTGSHQRVKPQDVLNMTVRWPESHTDLKTSIRLLYDLFRSNSRQSQTISGLRNTLLPKLISGELRITAAEGLVEAAV